MPGNSRPTVSLLAAVAANGVIGRDNALPWHLPEDLRRFKTLTMGHPIIMGRKTFQAIGRALPGRDNIVITHQPGLRAEGCTMASSLEAALGCARDAEEVFIIGGGEIYRAALPRADRLYLTEIAAELAGEAHFPAFRRSDWCEVSREHREADGAAGLAFDFVLYERAT